MPLPAQFQRFRPRLLDALAAGYDRQRFFADLGAGITVGIVALPLAMAFAIASGVKPEQGLFTAIIAGLLISLLGGSQVQIGGPAGAFIVIVYGIVQRYGLANLLIATSLAGIALFLMGLFKLGALVRYLPVSIVIGFTNGIAVLIALSQLRDLLGLKLDKLPADFFGQLHALGTHIDSFNPYAFALGSVCVAGLLLWAQLFKPGSLVPQALLDKRATRLAARVPGPIIALVSLSAAAAYWQLPVETLGSRFGEIPRALPAFTLPAFNWATVQQLFIPTLTIAMLGAVESLLCARVADNLIEHARHDPNQELMAQGVANFFTPLFGGIPATGTIARTVTNVRAGAATPIAGIVHALTVLAIVLLAAPLASRVPLCVLAGILLVVAWNMGDWHEFARLRQFNVTYRTILVGTFVLTVVIDLTVAVEVGLVLACIFFIWRMSEQFRVEALWLPAAPPGVQVLELYGALFFGAIGKVETLPQNLPAGTHTVVLDTQRLVLMDSSGLDALLLLHRQLERQNMRLLLCGLNEQPASLLRRAGADAVLGEANIDPDLPTALAQLRQA